PPRQIVWREPFNNNPNETPSLRRPNQRRAERHPDLTTHLESCKPLVLPLPAADSVEIHHGRKDKARSSSARGISLPSAGSIRSRSTSARISLDIVNTLPSPKAK